jgi:predicted AlkP superfamily pyrophosphatase or phosphodiesterase
MGRLFSFFFRVIFFLLLLGFDQKLSAQDKIQRPKLVVGIVVDQMRWDYLYRYYDRYAADGGFKRLLSQGFSCENTFIPYIPTITACGHTCIYTGSVPAIHGITGNDWWDYKLNKGMYCSQDDSAKTIGSNSNQGKMSPANLLVTTICDEMRLATNFHSKVIGLAIKDRGAILPAGHSANAAYWYDNSTGDWISSSYYLQDLPAWVKEHNAKKLADKYYAQNWNTLYPLTTYTQSTENDKPYENKPLGPGFPYSLDRFVGKNYGVLPLTPYGNAFTLEMAKAAVAGEQLGSGAYTDFLAISLSTPDYIGHTFGPNSVEAEDGFLRLDRDLANFLNYLDEKIGKGQYLLFLSADHGAANIPGFLLEHKIPAGHFEDQNVLAEINKGLKDKFGLDQGAVGIINYQVYLNRTAIELKKKSDEAAIRKWVIDFLQKVPGVARAFDIEEIGQTPLNAKVRDMVVNGYYPSRSGDIQIIFDPQWIEGFPKGTTHGSWNPYDSHIPLLWYGWNIKTGKTNRETYMVDVAPTLAAMLHIQMPSGSVGHVIEEIAK